MKRAFSLSVKVLHSRRAHSPFVSRSRFFTFAFFGFHFFTFRTQASWIFVFLEIFFQLHDLSIYIFFRFGLIVKAYGRNQTMISDCVIERGKPPYTVIWSVSLAFEIERGFMDCVTILWWQYQWIRIAKNKAKKIEKKLREGLTPNALIGKDKCKEYLLNVIGKNIYCKSEFFLVIY